MTNKEVKSFNSFQEIYAHLSSIDVAGVKGATSQGKDGLTYIEYVYVEKTMAEIFGDDYQWKIVTFDKDGYEREGGIPFQVVPNGALVYVDVTVKGYTRRQYLPVQGDRKINGELRTNIPLVLNNMNPNDLNAAIRRCLVKCVAIKFGLGHKIYWSSTFSTTDTEENTVVEEEEAKVNTPQVQPQSQQEEEHEPEEEMTSFEKMLSSFEPEEPKRTFTLEEVLDYRIAKPSGGLQSRTFRDIYEQRPDILINALQSIVSYYERTKLFKNDYDHAKALLGFIDNGELDMPRA